MKSARSTAKPPSELGRSPPIFPITNIATSWSTGIDSLPTSWAGRPAMTFSTGMYEAMRIAIVESFELRDDCLTTLEGLRKLGLGLAIVSNIDDDYFVPMVERCGIGPYVEPLDELRGSRELQARPRLLPPLRAARRLVSRTGPLRR